MSTFRRFVCLSSSLVAAAAACVGPIAAAADERREQIDATITELMEKHVVPGVSVAVIDNYAIDWAAGYGRLSVNSDEPVTPETMFQAASISKPVAAAAALVLVQEGKLGLDDEVNKLLRSWKIPDAAVTKNNPVQLRHLLSHSGGLTVHGFPGYRTFARRPTLVEVLDGAGPANTDPIRAFIKPGYSFRYSGGGYCVLQQLLLDLQDGATFPKIMHARVLEPLEMTHSTYEQPLPKTRSEPYARGHRENHAVVLGGFHVYPEMAAAGLWTTPSDLARFAIDLSQSHAHGAGKLLTQETVGRMLTVEKGSYGLGLAVRGAGDALRFSHGGSNEGFRCLLLAYPGTGQGVVIMTNAETGGLMLKDAVKTIRAAYGWPE